MAANGMQFTENQLNAMYQQQMMTQQTYQQWIMALSPAQRVHLQQRMTALMREVQHQMAQIMQQQQQQQSSTSRPDASTNNSVSSDGSDLSISYLATLKYHFLKYILPLLKLGRLDRFKSGLKIDNYLSKRKCVCTIAIIQLLLLEIIARRSTTNTAATTPTTENNSRKETR